ncbi:MAG TPA: PAS domain S-box protein [Vicinamibacterales bacterium]|nr:PAS domain S-box protein [Vicinamibacterales bacterium]
MTVRLSLILLLALGPPAAAQTVTATPGKAILVLHSDGYDVPSRIAFDAALAGALRAGADAIDLYSETIDSSRFRGEAQMHRTRGYLRERYADKRIAVIVAVYDGALEFLLDTDDPLFAGIPVAALLSDDPHTLPERVLAVWSGPTFGRTAALALQLHPESRQIALIDAPQPDDAGESVYLEAVKQVTAAAPQTSIVPLRNLPLEMLLPRVQALPPDTIVMVVGQPRGRRDGAIGSQDAVREIARIAPVPVYVATGQFVGGGALGGVVVSVEREATHLAALALQMAKGPSIRVATPSSTAVPMFDGRQLRRWSLDESRLPADSVVLFRQPSPWVQYKPLVVGAAAIVVMQALLISGLVVQGVRRRRTELALRESERRFRVMADTAPVLIWRSNIDRGFDFFNKPWLEFRGRSDAQERGRGWTEGLHPDDRDACLRAYEAAFDEGKPFNFECRFQRADGTYRWLINSGVPRYDEGGRFAGYVGSALDITDRKEIEESNRDLAGRLINAQEAERTRIARDLHDDLSQQLAGIAIMLSGLKRRITRAGADPDIDLTVSTLQERTATLAEAVRNLSHELHPSVLEPTGLEATLRRLCDDAERHHHIQLTLTTAGDLRSLKPDVALCLFRITQEALGNIVRHARATTVEVGLNVTAEHVGLSVTDNGVGFVTTDRSGHGLGLRSMDERVRLAKGTVTVKSAPGHGSSVIVKIPLAAA